MPDNELELENNQAEVEAEDAQGPEIGRIADQILKALAENSDRFYYQDGKLMDVRVFPDGTIESKAVSKSTLVTHMRPHRDWSDKVLNKYASHILNLSEIQNFFPKLTAIHTMPVLRPDFTLVSKGHDSTTGFRYVPCAAIEGHRFNLNPKLADAKKALELLQYPFLDFPIAAEPDRTNTIAFILTLIARTAIDTLCPVLAIDASGQSSGKTLLGETFSLISSGKRLSWVLVDKGLSEVEKGIKSALLNHERLIGVDNITGLFKSPTFAGIVTGHDNKIRNFGTLQRVAGTKNPNFILNGNNLKFDTDIRKRVFWVKMWHENPASRDKTKFRVFQDHKVELDKFLLENWITYYDAAMTIIQAWRVAGMPKRKPRSSMDKYGQWESIVGGMLEFVGITNFLENQDERSNAADEEQQELVRFMDLVTEKYPVVLQRHLGVPLDTIAQHLLDDWKGVLADVSGGSIAAMRQSLGIFLSKKAGVNIQGRIMDKKKKAEGSNLIIWDKR